MKIQILKNISDCIDGYNPVFIDNGDINIDVPDNSVSSILVLNSIEEIPFNLISNFLEKIKRLLRINGKIVITGVDINCLCRDLLNRTLNTKIYNEIVFNRKGIYDSKELTDALSAMGLTIEKVLLKGSTYELHAVRGS